MRYTGEDMKEQSRDRAAPGKEGAPVHSGSVHHSTAAGALGLHS